tara:strand:- start:440 stop:613 length:174 start_codon:yes stop_codon:yes gene_type:complete
MNTYEYYTYYGRDRDDWDGPHTIEASSHDEAIRKAWLEWKGTNYRVWNSKVKLIDNQ